MCSVPSYHEDQAVLSLEVAITNLSPVSDLKAKYVPPFLIIATRWEGTAVKETNQDTQEKLTLKLTL